jgi:hypothetical protein
VKISRRGLAIHEAGHALLATMFGIPVDRAEIHRDGSGYVQAALATADPWAATAVFVSGHVAMQLVGEGGGDPCDDYDQALALAAAALGCDKGARQVQWELATLERQVRSLLQQHRLALMAVASALERSGRLSGDEIIELMRGPKNRR